MPSSFHGIEIASRALRAFQRGLDVTGNNIANVNTPGYARQVVNYTQTDPLSFFQGGWHSLGTGVTIGSINQIRDQFLESRRLDAQSDLGRMGTLSDQLGRVESVFYELEGNGISDALSALFDSWSALASNPTETASRFQVQLAGRNLASRIQSTHRDLQTLHGQVGEQIGQAFDTIDQLSAEIARLNGEIRGKVAMGEQPNDLIDRRTSALQHLANHLNVVTETSEDGTVQVFAGSYALVDGTGARAIQREYNSTTGQIGSGTTAFSVRSGVLGGLLETANRISGYQTSLDNLANALRTEFNALHAQGVTNQNPSSTGINFFNDSVAGAADFALSAEVEADSNAIAANTTGNAGDGGLALNLSRLRDKNVDALGGVTLSGYFGNLVGQIGRESANALATYNTEQAVLDQIDAQIQSVSGVSLDDEMTNMLRLQRSYQAAAKMLTVFDQLTEDLINLLNR